jgi:hypothetical protein
MDFIKRNETRPYTGIMFQVARPKLFGGLKSNLKLEPFFFFFLTIQY